MKRFLIFALLIANVSYNTTAEAKILASIKPVKDIICEVKGSCDEVELLIEGANSPHHYNLKPSDIKKINDAALVIYVGNEFETFLPKVKASAKIKEHFIEISDFEGLKILPARRNGAFEKHDEHGHKEHGHEDKKHYADDHHEELEAKDLHIWLGLDNAKIIAKNIAEILTVGEPKQKDFYEENYKKFAKKIDALKSEIETELGDNHKKPYIVFHDAYQYFEKDFSTNAVGSIVLEAGESISAKRLVEIRNKVKETGAECVFKEPQFDGKIIEPAIENLDVKIGTLDPIGVNSKNYFETVRNVAKGIAECLR